MRNDYYINKKKKKGITSMENERKSNVNKATFFYIPFLIRLFFFFFF